MQPVLFEVLGFPVNSYGVSKALAAVVAGWLLAREFRRLGWDPDRAWSIVMAATVLGFVGAKAYYLAENLGNLTLHHFGGSGFTWYGGLVAGALTVLVMARRDHLPLGRLAAVMTAPLAVAYGIGRIGCFLSGDGSYGKPSDLPWAMAFPEGTMPVYVPVHPTALYEAITAFALAALLWTLRTRVAPLTQIGLYSTLSGTARLLVEEVRLNPPAVLGLTQPQLWSLLLIAAGIALLVVARRQPRRDTSGGTPATAESRPAESRPLAARTTPDTSA